MGKLGERISSRQSVQNQEDQGLKLQRLLESNKKLIEKQRGHSTKVRSHSKTQDKLLQAEQNKQSEPHFESEPADQHQESYMSNQNFKLPVDK